MTKLAFADRVQEYAQNVGQGTVTLLGAGAPNLKTFAAAGLNGQTVPYVILHRTSNQWEVGYGVYTAAGTALMRAAVLSNSLGTTNLVNFSAGVVDVWNDLPASKIVALDADSPQLSLPGNVVTPGTVTAVGFVGAGINPTVTLRPTALAAQQALVQVLDPTSGNVGYMGYSGSGTPTWFGIVNSTAAQLRLSSATGPIVFEGPGAVALWQIDTTTGALTPGAANNIGSSTARVGTVFATTFDGALAWSHVTGTPTTLAGYGITDAQSATGPVAWSRITATPTTLAGYGITDAQSATGPVAWSRITATPTTLGGYGITDAVQVGTITAPMVGAGTFPAGTFGFVGPVTHTDATSTATTTLDVRNTNAAFAGTVVNIQPTVETASVYALTVSLPSIGGQPFAVRGDGVVIIGADTGVGSFRLRPPGSIVGVTVAAIMGTVQVTAQPTGGAAVLMMTHNAPTGPNRFFMRFDDADGTVATVGTDASDNFTIAPVHALVLGSQLLFSPDNTYDIGAPGATRPRNLYLAGTVTAATLVGALAWSNITGTPTTLAGYGITDAQSATGPVAWSRITATPTTIAGYGITDAVQVGTITAPMVGAGTFPAGTFGFVGPVTIAETPASNGNVLDINNTAAAGTGSHIHLHRAATDIAWLQGDASDDFSIWVGTFNQPTVVNHTTGAWTFAAPLSVLDAGAGTPTVSLRNTNGTWAGTVLYLQPSNEASSVFALRVALPNTIGGTPFGVRGDGAVIVGGDNGQGVLRVAAPSGGVLAGTVAAFSGWVNINGSPTGGNATLTVANASAVGTGALVNFNIAAGVNAAAIAVDASGNLDFTATPGRSWVFNNQVTVTAEPLVFTQQGSAPSIAGSIGWDGSVGLYLQCAHGVVFDFRLYGPTGTTAIQMPTGTTNLTLTGTTTLANGAILGVGGAGGAGALFGSAAYGLVLQEITGTIYDFAIMNPAQTQFIMRVPFGTTGITFGGAVGFNLAAPLARPSITGSRGGNAALASLLTALNTYGLVTDSTTA